MNVQSMFFSYTINLKYFCIICFLQTSSVSKPVIRLRYNVISDTSVNISWSEPIVTDGVILGYYVRYGEFEGNTSTYTIALPDTHLTVEGLG